MGLAYILKQDVAEVVRLLKDCHTKECRDYAAAGEHYRPCIPDCRIVRQRMIDRLEPWCEKAD